MMSRGWSKKALSVLKAGEPLVLVTQCLVSGSAPREAGAKMLVLADEIYGTIGGGCLEYRAIDQARALLASDKPSSLLQDYPLGPLLGQCCGGHVRLLIERITSQDIGWLQTIVDNDHEPLWLETDLRATHGPRKRILSKDLSGAMAGCFLDYNRDMLGTDRPLREACGYYREKIEAPYPAIILYGAGHVGRALARLLQDSAFPLFCFDNREECCASSSQISITHFTNADDVVSTITEPAVHLIFTHSHALDYQLCKAVLSTDNFTYCGVIGSATKRARFEARLNQDGLPEKLIKRLYCPIGLSAITQKTPHAIAVSIAAELYTLLETLNGAHTRPVTV